MGCPLLFYIKIVAHYVNIYQVITICSEQFNIILPNSVKSEFDNMKFSKLRLTRQIKTEDNSLVFDNEVATSIIKQVNA